MMISWRDHRTKEGPPNTPGRGTSVEGIHGIDGLDCVAATSTHGTADEGERLAQGQVT